MNNNILKTQSIASLDLESMLVIAKAFGEVLKPGDVICLNGDLGAGKTTFTQGLALGLEVPDEQYVTSPSFAIMHEYTGRCKLYHMDFYRLGSVDEIFDLGFEELLYGSGVSVIEWSERMEGYLPEKRINIQLLIDGSGKRNLSFDWKDQSWDERVNTITQISNNQ